MTNSSTCVIIGTSPKGGDILGMETRVKEVRKHLGMTQTEFGDALGVSRDVINSYERGRVTPTQTFLDLL